MLAAEDTPRTRETAPVAALQKAPATSGHVNSPASLLRVAGAGARERQTKDLLLYFHVPFCTSKCHFCDWVVGYNKTDLVNTGDLREQYVEALCRQITSYGPVLQGLGYAVTNIYWGGGTPTRLTPRQMARIYDTAARHIDLKVVKEHTAECSPETVTAEHLAVLRERGLNRVSAGAQSFHPQILRRMGRAHSNGQIEHAVQLFKDAGLNNFNLDLITGFPGQDEEISSQSIQRAIELDVPHISLYMFREFAGDLVTFKQMQSGFATQRSRDERAEAYTHAKALLENAGYSEYVVGYFAKSPAAYFDSEDYYFSIRGDYFGFGAGAGSVLGRWVLKSGDAQRYGDSHVRAYVADPLSLVAGPVRVMPDALFTDGYFKAFATREGIRFDRWRDQFGMEFSEFRRQRPGIQQWFSEREREGARFVEDAKGIALSANTWIDTMIWRR